MKDLVEIINKNKDFWELSNEEAQKAICFFADVAEDYIYSLTELVEKTENPVLKRVFEKELKELRQFEPGLRRLYVMLNEALNKEEHENND